MPMEGRSVMKGKVVLVPFPFDDLSSTKVRLAFISSQVPADILKTDMVIDAAERDFRSTGLRVSSVLRLHRLMTVTTSFIQRELGELSPQVRVEMDRRLKILFELS